VTVVAELDEAPPVDRISSGAPEAPRPSVEERGRLPVTGLVGVAAGAAFAGWTSLTCFVC